MLVAHEQVADTFTTHCCRVRDTASAYNNIVYTKHTSIDLDREPVRHPRTRAADTLPAQCRRAARRAVLERSDWPLSRHTTCESIDKSMHNISGPHATPDLLLDIPIRRVGDLNTTSRSFYYY